MEGPSLQVKSPVWKPLLGLLLLASAIHSWQIANTTVAARDSIGFIRYVHRLEREPWLDVMDTSLHPPVYPLTIWLISKPAGLFWSTADPHVMQYCAQAASALAGVLLVIPMFFLGRELFNQRVGFWSAALFQCLPVGSRAVADGLTEGIYLLLTTTGLLLAVWGLRRARSWYFALAGVCGGFAYLTRPEGLELPLATLIVLGGWALLQASCLTWRRTILHAGALLTTLGLVSVPYMLHIDGLTNKTSGTKLLDAGLFPTGDQNEDAPTARGRVLLATWMKGWSESNQGTHFLWALLALTKEIGKSFHYLAWIPFACGLWWFRGRLRTEPWLALPLVWWCIHAAILLRLASVMGYLSERHTIVFVCIGSYWAVAGLLEMARRWTLRVPARRPKLEIALLLFLTLFGLPSSLKTLHSSRAGFRDAGDWLARHSDPSDTIIDPFCWTHYYAGRVYLERYRIAYHDQAMELVAEEQEIPPPVGHEPVWYSVLDKSHHHSRLPSLQYAQELAKKGKPVYHWPTDGTLEEADIIVYATPRR